MALIQAKKELRKRIKKILLEIPSDSLDRQTSVSLKTLFHLREYQDAKSISVYLSMPSGEISTVKIIDDAFCSGKKVFVPYTYKWGGQPSAIMDMLQLKSLQDYESLQRDSWGIPTPSAASISQRKNCFGRMGKSEMDDTPGAHGAGLDVIIMPGMAFDRYLGRLGHGKGFYDFFLQRYHSYAQATKTEMPFLVGLALNEQVLPAPENVPRDATDWKLDALILGDGQILRRNSNSGPVADTA